MYSKGNSKTPHKKQADKQKKATSSSISCFVCKGPHRMKDCPKLGTLAAMVEGQEARREEESAEMGSLRLLNALTLA